MSTPDPKAMLHLGAIARAAYAEKPTDLNDVIHAVQGGRKLLSFVEDRLAAMDSDKVDRETVNLLAHAIQAMGEAHRTLALTYALSGAAMDDLFANVRESLREPR